MQGSNKRIVLSAIILCFLIISFFLFFIFREEADRLVEEKDLQEENSEESLSTVELTLYDDRKTFRWELTASELTRRKEEGYLELQPLKVKVFNHQEGKQLYQFTASHGNYLHQKERLEIDGPLRVEKNGHYLRAERMVWETGEDIIYGYEQVKIETNTFVLTGSNFRTDSGLTYFTVTGEDGRQAQLSWKEQNDDPK